MGSIDTSIKFELLQGGSSTPTYQPEIDVALSAIANHVSDETFAAALDAISAAKRRAGLKAV